MAYEVTRGSLAKFRGTPLECEAWMRRQFEIMRIGLRETGDEDDKMDVFERTVWDINLYATDGLTTQKARPEWIEEAGLIETEIELFKLIKNANTAKEETVDSSSDTMSSEVDDLEG